MNSRHVPAPTPVVIGPRRRRVLELCNQGLSVRAIALQLGISTQATYAHVNALREAGLIPKEAS